MAPADADWDPVALDWSDPGEAGDPAKSSPYDDITPHHEYLTAVHAIHMPTGEDGELLLFHGKSEQRRWPIGGPASAMDWLPIPVEVEWGAPAPNDVETYPDIFCSGHVRLGDGRLFFAGGNINDAPAWGGLTHAFIFDPQRADPVYDPMSNDPVFGWDYVGEMAVDRWYPTLTLLGDGRVLISGGLERTSSTGPNNSASAPTNVIEVFDPSDGSITNVGADFPAPAGAPMPVYPFMFVLPNGDVFYAGSEESTSSALYNGRVLLPDYNNAGTWAWHTEVFDSDIPGGSAVMYAPGKILKSGGKTNNNIDGAIAGAEVIDLSGYTSGMYAGAPEFNTLNVPDMNRRRHFHTLTVLPDGRVLATGGNSGGNGTPRDSPYYECNHVDAQGNWLTCAQGCPSDCAPLYDDVAHGPSSNMWCSVVESLTCTEDADCPGNGAQCTTGGVCRLACQSDADCPVVTGCTGNCNPSNIECFAQLEAEIWDPTCPTDEGQWTLLDAQQFPRMYHSTALLLRDGRVISMGGGHTNGVAEYCNAEYIEPKYTWTNDDPPAWTIADDDIPNDEPGEVVYVEWDSTFDVTLDDEDLLSVGRVTLLRLGSVTHQFDMDQRFIPLNFSQEPGEPVVQVIAPEKTNTPGFNGSHQAPPGDYMLFIHGPQREFGPGKYVRVGPPSMLVWGCGASGSFTASQVTCTGEPNAGACRPSDEVTQGLAVPTIQASGGTTPGWYVAVPSGMVQDSTNPTSDELVAVTDRCEEACAAWYADTPGAQHNCATAGSFATVEPWAASDGPSLDLVAPFNTNAAGLFTGQSLSCDITRDCASAFDEHLTRAIPERVTPASELVGEGIEYRVAFGTKSRVHVNAGGPTVSARPSGSVGYATCRDGSTTSPCPFYLGSLDILVPDAMTVEMSCADGTDERKTLSNLVVTLAQPGFGIAEQGSTARGKAFPPGALRFETGFDIRSDHYAATRPNGQPLFAEVDGVEFEADGLTVTVQVPCNASVSDVALTFDLEDPGDGTALQHPPNVAITTPSSVSCGVSTPLTATATDPDDDLDRVEWFVDGVPIDPATTSLTFTTGHLLEAVAFDTRGGATTDRRTIQCQ